MEKIWKIFGLLTALLFLSLQGCSRTEIEIWDAAEKVETPQAEKTILTIKNMSFSGLREVSWHGQRFTLNDLEDAIPVGASVSKEVIPGSGHIYFIRQNNMTAARTKDPVTVKEKESVEFVFTDTTMIVGNSNNTDTLKDL